MTLRMEHIRCIALMAALLGGATLGFAQGGSLGSNGGPPLSANGQPLAGINVSVCQPMATTAASVSNGLATLTMASNPITAGFAAGQTIWVSGFTGSDTVLNGGSFTNGTGISNGYAVLSVSSTSIIYALSGTDTATTNGTVLAMGSGTQACAPLSSVYADPAETMPITQPIVTDGMGNWNAFVPPNSSLYYVQFYGSAIATTFSWMQVPPSNPALKPGSTDVIQYVSPNGNDSNDGLSWGTAKLTILAAYNACSTHCGTIFLSNAGNVTSDIALSPGGSAISLCGPLTVQGQGKYLTWVAEPNTGSNITVPDTAGCQGVKIRDLTFQLQTTSTSPVTAVEVDGSSTHAANNDEFDYAVYANNTNGARQGLYLNQTGGPAYISLNKFEVLCDNNVTQCLDSNGDEANSIDCWVTASASGAGTQCSLASYDDFIRANLEQGTNALAISGNGNLVDVKCDIGPGFNSGPACLDDTGIGNIYRFTWISGTKGTVPASATVLEAQVNGASSGSLLQTTGIQAALSTKSAAYTLSATDSWINVTGTTTITVPHALAGQRWVVFNSGSGTVTVQPDSGNINGASSITLSANTGKEVTCDGTNCFAH